MSKYQFDVREFWREFVFVVWLILMALSTPVAAQTFADSMGHYDYHSLKWGLLMSVLGGVGITIYNGLHADTAYTQFFKTLFRNALKSLIVGVLVHIVIEAFFDGMDADTRLVVIVLAGASPDFVVSLVRKRSRVAAETWADGVASRLPDAGGN